MQYNGYWDTDRAVAEIHFDKAVRIVGITGWIDRQNSHIGWVGISADFLDQGFFATFPLESVTDAPGKWQGVGSLKWDLQPGAYLVGFGDGYLPFSFGYNGPHSSAPQPDGWGVIVDGRFQESPYPFGVRIYGTLLSTVPESSTYGLVGGLALLAAAFVRLRRRLPAGGLAA